ncbi:MAG TPA: tryptophan synthase subunit alpha [Candidatus Baltobacteraceae bacterium]
MLAPVFARARGEYRSAFVPYVMAGDPDVATTRRILTVLREAGADAIELGIPYGDPLADGPTIAAAGVRALRNGIAIEHVLDLAREVRDGAGPPIVLFTYFNPVYRYGIERFARDASAAGVAGCIVPDVALEETAELQAALTAHGVEMPLLIAPSTPLERASRIAERSGGFAYVVSRLGVTGAARVPDFSPLRAHLAALRTVTRKPLAVGFGVSLPEHVREIAPVADGIIVGSALIEAYGDSREQAAADRVRTFVVPLIAAAGYERPANL